MASSVAAKPKVICAVMDENPLTTRRFTRKINTRFYHAYPATCPVRPYKQRAGHSSISDPAPAGLGPILAPYDDTTS